MPLLLIKAFTFVKKYWQLALLILGVVIGAVLFKKTDNSFSDRLKKIQDAHDEELKKIEDARKQEQLEHDANVRKLQETLDVVQKHYDDAKKELDENKKKEIENIVKQYNNDPEGLAKKLSSVTGFNVVLPK